MVGLRTKILEFLWLNVSSEPTKKLVCLCLHGLCGIRAPRWCQVPMLKEDPHGNCIYVSARKAASQPSAFSIPWQQKGGPKWTTVWHIVGRKGSCVCGFFFCLFLLDFFVRIVIEKNKIFKFLLPILTFIPILTSRHWIPRKVEEKEETFRRLESPGKLDLSQGHLGGSLLTDTSLKNHHPIKVEIKSILLKDFLVIWRKYLPFFLLPRDLRFSEPVLNSKDQFQAKWKVSRCWATMERKTKNGKDKKKGGGVLSRRNLSRFPWEVSNCGALWTLHRWEFLFWTSFLTESQPQHSGSQVQLWPLS